MRPRIAVLPLQDTEKQTLWINPLYLGGIEEAGGLPVLLPLSVRPSDWDAYVDEFDGFVFTGGQDIDPALYGQAKRPECCYQAPMRDAQELYMLRRLLAMDKPVLGICRGLQILNVAAGGTLYQDLFTQFPTPVTHRQNMPYDVPHHQVSLVPGTRIHEIMGMPHLSVNSMHHQAVLESAPCLRVSAVASDGLIEALEHPEKRFLLGIQWHPEHLWQTYDSSRRLWAALVDACRS